MLVLSIDQSMACSGWAILKNEDGNISLITSGTIPTKLDKNDPMNSGRLEYIYNTVSNIIKDAIYKYTKIDAIVIERFFSKSYQGTLAVAEVRGIIKLLSSIYLIPIYEFAPQSVRKELVGNGRAEKEEVATYLKTKFKLGKDITLDETDAIAQGVFTIGVLSDRSKTIAATTAAVKRSSGKKRTSK